MINMVGPQLDGFKALAPGAMHLGKSEAEQEYLIKKSKVADTLAQEVSATAQELGGSTGTAIDSLKMSIVAHGALLGRKRVDLAVQQEVAGSYYLGLSPFDQTPSSYAGATFHNIASGRLKLSNIQEALNASYRAAYTAKLRELEIELLQVQIATLENALAAAEMQARLQAEAQAQADARARAQAEADARAQAEAQVRAQAVALAQAKAREAAVKAAAERAQAEKAIREANSYRIPLAKLDGTPAVIMATGAAPALQGGLTLSAALRSAVLAVGAASLASVALPFLVRVAALLYSPKLGNGELQENYLLSTPLADLSVALDAAAQAEAIERGWIELPVRMGDKREDIGPTELFAIRTDGAAIPSTVAVLAAHHDASTGEYVVTTEDVPPRNLVWTPAVEPMGSSTTLPATRPPKKVLVGPKLEPLEGRLDTYPDLPDVGFDDYVIIFPADSGLAPLYVMFKSRRHITGIGVGKGKQFSGELLVEGNRNGSPIPSQIASKLRGRSHSSWNLYRQRLWRLVAKSPLFEGQFSPEMRALMLRGLAPYAPRDERVGSRVKYEIHHIKSIRDGGGVYDSDNLVIISPRFHIDMHR
ncbi:S-type pyocin domain-containing protein [Pantoea sp. Tr-811]|uniref:S-type pyocin domain-containing protein n=1 Tax=Pantoea sp. Tr-811 TaxID=2608361 RepID=UPI0014241636|nr:S-type pyocin domain-containing protein [Pantoea sp. Tr-811]